MLKQNYIADGNPYGIGNFWGYRHNCGGDFMASYCCAIITTDLQSSTNASDIVIKDEGGFFEGENVEAVLAEIGEKLNKAIVDIKFTDEDELEYTSTDGKVTNLGPIPAKLDIDGIIGGNAPNNGEG